MKGVQTVGVVGAGVIGAGWAARALHCGLDVIVTDINSGMEAWLNETVDNASKMLAKLTEGIPMPVRGSLEFTTDLAAMARCTDFIQECVPENIELKRSVLGTISSRAASDVVIASSTSGFMPTDLQTGLDHPERILVGHPFNPVYLCPLVELVGGRQTCNVARGIARKFYEGMGMHVLAVRREVPGHIGDRLQEAMWREILHALNDDIATTSELDESIVYGPGLRWAAMGMNQLYMISGGSGGARHFMKQFGPALDFPWCHMKAPELTDELIDRFVEGTAEQAGGRSIRELETIRDECLVALQRVLASHDIGAGQALNRFRERMANPNSKQQA